MSKGIQTNRCALRLGGVVYIPAIPFPYKNLRSDYGEEIQRKWKQEGESKLNKSGRAKRRHFCSVLIRLPASTYAEFPRTDRRLLVALVAGQLREFSREFLREFPREFLREFPRDSCGHSRGNSRGTKMICRYTRLVKCHGPKRRKLVCRHTLYVDLILS